MFKVETYPIDYARVQNNLGIAYFGLGLIKDKETNLEKGLLAYNKALNVTTFNDYPLDYAQTQMNIGIIYAELGNVKNNQTNRKNAEKGF